MSNLSPSMELMARALNLLEDKEAMGTLSTEEVNELLTLVQEEVRRRKLPEALITLKEALATAEKMSADISLDSQYGGPTMYTHSQSDLASGISRLAFAIKKFLPYLEEQFGA